jgi:Ca-activated chloride channel family protein
MRGAGLCVLLWCVASSAAAASSTWSNLWSTPEQQAQHLLDSRQAAAAAPLFKDPRRRGYAQLRAGEYAQAAKSLAPLRDADSLYNRGNALAHTGQLQGALAAYDAALKQSPGNRDIVHNRDLVARAQQKQQQQSPKSQQGSNQSGARAGKSGSQNNTGGQQGRASGQQAGSNEQQGRTGGQQAGSNEQQGRTGGQQAGSNEQQGRTGGQQAGGGEQPRSAASQRGSAGEQQGPSGGQQSGAQAQQEAGGNTGEENSALQAHTAHGVDAAANPSTSAEARAGSKSPASNAAMQDGRSKGATQPPPPPRSEQSLALDQWLRGIPDDSGELLRRKFMIEHMMKQQENAP